MYYHFRVVYKYTVLIRRKLKQVNCCECEEYITHMNCCEHKGYEEHVKCSEYEGYEEQIKC